MPCVLFYNLEILQNGLHYFQQSQAFVTFEKFEASFGSLAPQLLIKRIVFNDIQEFLPFNLVSHERDAFILEGIVHIGENIWSPKQHTNVAKVRSLLYDSVLVQTKWVHNINLPTLNEMNMRRVLECFVHERHLDLFRPKNVWLLP